jgi:hypothetical protein
MFFSFGRCWRSRSALGPRGDDGEGARGGEDEGPPKLPSSSLSGPGGEAVLEK